MEPATLGRVAVPPDPTPIQEGQTRLGKCSVSFAITLPSNAIGEAPNESSRQAVAEKLDLNVRYAPIVLWRQLAPEALRLGACEDETENPCGYGKFTTGDIARKIADQALDKCDF
jgi:hypothetical protein